MLDEECAAFRATINNFLRKQKRKLIAKYGELPREYNKSVQEAIHFCDHGIHILTNLTIKRESLSNAIDGFRILCDDIISLMKTYQHKPSDLKPILKDIFMHFFVKFIHIRDGFVLLTSGECRHYGDSNIAKKNQKFCSRLSTLSKRFDGYTKLYSSNRGYSGWGWDEFHNEDVGVRRLLLDQLRICSVHPRKLGSDSYDIFLNGEVSSQCRENVWEKLLESGAQLFESAFDDHENKMKELQTKIESIRSAFMSKVETYLSFPGFVMVLEDKFERLQMKSSNSLGFSQFIIQRQGDAFLGTDENGALPSGASKEYWISNMQLPDTLRNYQKKKSISDTSEVLEIKRRKVIADSDDESSNDNTNHTAIPKDYLRVTVKSAELNTITNSSESVMDIKRGFGVNSSYLEISREGLEKEESATIVAAHVDEMSEVMQNSMEFPKENEWTPEISQLLSQIRDEKDNCEKFRAICKIRMNDEDDKWDAREALRLSLMRLGNACLEYHDIMKGGKDSLCLSFAKSCFQEALKVIKELDNLNCSDKCEENEKMFRKRAVLLCRGRCLANLGKTLFDQADIMMNSTLVSSSRQQGQIVLRQALSYLRAAERCAQSLHARAIVAIPMDLRTIEQKLDADKLECMSCHLQAFTFLSFGRIDQCIISIRKAAGLCSKVPLISENDDMSITRSKLYVIGDLYEGAIAAISIISSLLQDRYGEMNSVHEDTPVGSVHSLPVDDTSDITAKLRSGDPRVLVSTLLELLCEAYDQAAALSDDISKYAREGLKEEIDDIISKENMYTSQEILEFKSIDLEVYMDDTRKSSETKRPFLKEYRKRRFPIPRSDIFRNSMSNAHKERYRRIIVDESTSKPQNKSMLQNSKVDRAKNIEKNLEDDLLEKFFSEDIDSIDNFDINPHEETCDIYFNWGNELFTEKGLNPNAYPNCQPAKPPEMIQELGLDHDS